MRGVVDLRLAGDDVRERLQHARVDLLGSVPKPGVQDGVQTGRGHLRHQLRLDLRDMYDERRLRVG